MPLLKNGFLEKLETWHVGLSCQYTHFMSFLSKSEHDTVADQATLSLFWFWNAIQILFQYFFLFLLLFVEYNSDIKKMDMPCGVRWGNTILC